MWRRIKSAVHGQTVEHGQPGSQKGQSLVEMAIISPLLVLLFIGVIEVGWAIRGYIVLLNADREATRFAARGWYLDFSESEVEDIGYGSVVSHTLASLAQRLPFDVLSEDPNGTLIASHYVVDTGKPCSDPPCNDTCAADKNNKDGGCDCSTPERREADYPYDDWVAHPGMVNYSQYTALYGIPRESRLDHEAIVAQLKEQNDAFNCTLNVKDPAAPWSPNSLVMVELFYDQPQLLGVPLISNYFTDPIHLYGQTKMRIVDDRTSPTSSQGGGCPLLPIAVHIDTLSGLSVGQSTPNIRNGTGAGSFGWLKWTDETEAVTTSSDSEEYLAAELANPRMAMNDFDEAYIEDSGTCEDSSDTVINAGDCVWSLTGNVNSSEVRALMDGMIGPGAIGRVPVYDVGTETGSNAAYHIIRFALVRLEAYDLGGNPKWIRATFEGWDDKACKSNGH